MHYKNDACKLRSIIALICLVIFQALIFLPDGIAFPFPGEDGTKEDLVRYYFSRLYTTKEICGFLMLYHGIIVSFSTIERIKRRLRLRRRQNQAPILLVCQKIYELRANGFTNVGYKSMWRLLNSNYNITVSQENVRNCLGFLDTNGVSLRRRHRLQRRSYYNSGPNYLIHIDGYDKIKPYGIAIHGAIDGYSRRILWLKAGCSNNNPRYIAKFYIDFVKELRRVPRAIRADAGTENVLVKDLHIALRFDHGDEISGSNSFLTGRSTGNQRIERLWRSLSEYLMLFWRNTFANMRDIGLFSTADHLHIECLRFCFLPLIQTQLNQFMENWNDHRIRRQRQEVIVPSGIPNVLYFQPEIYDSSDFSFPILCNDQTLSELENEHTSDLPVRGCSEDFMHLIGYLSGEEPMQALIPQTLDEAFQNFCTLIYICNGCRI